MGKVIGAVVAVVLLVGGFFGYRYWIAHEPAAESAPPPVVAPAAEVAPPAPTHYPVTGADESAQGALPGLDQSDGPMAQALTALLGQSALRKALIPENLIRHFVATVDNLPRGRVAARLMPIRPVGGVLVTSGSDDAPVLSSANGARYAVWVNLATQVDTRRLVALYVRFYPLCQEAYQQLGYPQGYFNDRLVVAIDDLLATPRLDAPPKLLSTHVLYQFADPELEGRSAGQKIMLRLGNDNATRIKAKLRDIKREITRANPQA